MVYIDTNSHYRRLLEEQKALPVSLLPRTLDIRTVFIDRDLAKQIEEMRRYRERTKDVSVGEY